MRSSPAARRTKPPQEIAPGLIRKREPDIKMRNFPGTPVKEREQQMRSGALALSQIDDADRRKRIRRTAILVALIPLAFYFGFIIVTLVRGSR
jgi:hypothetical protein